MSTTITIAQRPESARDRHRRNGRACQGFGGRAGCQSRATIGLDVCRWISESDDGPGSREELIMCTRCVSNLPQLGKNYRVLGSRVLPGSRGSRVGAVHEDMMRRAQAAAPVRSCGCPRCRPEYHYGG